MADVSTKNKSIKKEFANYVSMSILGLLGVSVYILADTFFISAGVGSLGLAALNIAIPIYNIMAALGLMIGIGAATRFSLTGDEKVFTHAILLAGIAALFFMIIGIFFSGPFVRLLGADDVIFDNTRIYAQVLLCFAPVFIYEHVMMAFIRNDGRPRLAMVALTIGSAANIVLDYIFIFPLGMGMFGAALATSVCPGLALLVLMTHILAKKNTFHLCKIKPNFRITKIIASLGVSSFITEIANGLVVIIFNLVILGITGNIGVAAYGIITNISMNVMAFFTGLAQGMQPLLSREHGRKNHENVKVLYKMGVMTSLGMALVIYLICAGFADQIISIFNSEGNRELAEIAKVGIILYFAAFFVVGLNVMNAGYYSAIDMPSRGFAIAVLRGLVVLIPTVLILSQAFGMVGVWLTLLTSDLLVFVGFLLYDKVIAKRKLLN